MCARSLCRISPLDRTPQPARIPRGKSARPGIECGPALPRAAIRGLRLAPSLCCRPKPQGPTKSGSPTSKFTTRQSANGANPSTRLQGVGHPVTRRRRCAKPHTLTYSPHHVAAHDRDTRGKIGWLLQMRCPDRGEKARPIPKIRRSQLLCAWFLHEIAPGLVWGARLTQQSLPTRSRGEVASSPRGATGPQPNAVRLAASCRGAPQTAVEWEDRGGCVGDGQQDDDDEELSKMSCSDTTKPLPGRNQETTFACAPAAMASPAAAFEFRTRCSEVCACLPSATRARTPLFSPHGRRWRVTQIRGRKRERRTQWT